MYVLTYMFCQQFSTQYVIEIVFLCNHNFAIFCKENTFVEEKKQTTRNPLLNQQTNQYFIDSTKSSKVLRTNIHMNI